jgi:hypothetical protein
MQQPAQRASAERRKLPRLQVDQFVGISFVDDGADWCRGSVTDCTELGLGLSSPRPAEPGTAVVIEWDSGYFVGAVRNCALSNNVWRLGVELEPVRAGKVLVGDLIRTAWCGVASVQ